MTGAHRPSPPATATSRARLLAPGLAVVVIAGCGAGASRGTQAEKPPRPSTATSIRAAPPHADVVRGCDRHHTGVGYGGVSEEALRESLRVGPVALGSLGVFKRSQLPAGRGGQRRFVAIESIAVVDAGAKVTVAIAPRDRGHAALIYDQGKFRSDGRYRLDQLDGVVRFEACADPTFNHGYSQFDGGFVVAGARCFSLDVYVAGRRYRRPGLAGC